MKRLIIIMLILALGLFMTGCKVTGGGWFIDQNNNKCTLGFVAQGDSEGCGLSEMFAAKGQFQFNDHVDTKIHAKVEGMMGTMLGTVGGYGFIGETKDEEAVVVIVTDLGEPGADAGDGVYVKFGSQEWYGVLGGGNIQGH